MWVLSCEHAVRNWPIFRIGRCLLFWSSCSGWPGHKVECKGDFGGQVVHWRCQHCQLCLAGGSTSWKTPLLNYCILTFCRWWVCLSWTPPCQKEQETKTGKTVVRIWILPSRTQGVTTVAVALLFKSHFWASTKKPFTKLKITRESQVWGTVAVALQHLIKTWFRSWEVRGSLLVLEAVIVWSFVSWTGGADDGGQRLGMALRPRVKRSRRPTEVEKRSAAQN